MAPVSLQNTTDNVSNQTGGDKIDIAISKFMDYSSNFNKSLQEHNITTQDQVIQRVSEFNI